MGLKSAGWLKPTTALRFEKAIKFLYMLTCRALIHRRLIESRSQIGKYILQVSRKIVGRSQAQVELYLTQI